MQPCAAAGFEQAASDRRKRAPLLEVEDGHWRGRPHQRAGARAREGRAGAAMAEEGGCMRCARGAGALAAHSFCSSFSVISCRKGSLEFMPGEQCRTEVSTHECPFVWVKGVLNGY